jgi:hypothetical protein
MVFDDQHNAGLCGRVGFVRVLPRGRVGFVRVLPRVLDTSVLQVLVRRAKVRRVLVLVRLRRRYIWNSQIPLWQYCAQVLQYAPCLLIKLHSHACPNQSVTCMLASVKCMLAFVTSVKGAECCHVNMGFFSKCHVGKKSHVDMRRELTLSSTHTYSHIYLYTYKFPCISLNPCELCKFFGRVLLVAPGGWVNRQRSAAPIP